MESEEKVRKWEIKDKWKRRKVQVNVRKESSFHLVFYFLWIIVFELDTNNLCSTYNTRIWNNYQLLHEAEHMRKPNSMIGLLFIQNIQMHNKQKILKMKVYAMQFFTWIFRFSHWFLRVRALSFSFSASNNFPY